MSSDVAVECLYYKYIHIIYTSYFHKWIEIHHPRTYCSGRQGMACHNSVECQRLSGWCRYTSRSSHPMKYNISASQIAQLAIYILIQNEIINNEQEQKNKNDIPKQSKAGIGEEPSCGRTWTFDRTPRISPGSCGCLQCSCFRCRLQCRHNNRCNTAAER